MSFKLMRVRNWSWDFWNDLDEPLQLSGGETKLQKIVQVIQGHVIITLLMKCRIPNTQLEFLQLTVKGLVTPHPRSKHTAYIYNKTIISASKGLCAKVLSPIHSSLNRCEVSWSEHQQVWTLTWEDRITLPLPVHHLSSPSTYIISINTPTSCETGRLGMTPICFPDQKTESQVHLNTTKCSMSEMTSETH